MVIVESPTKAKTINKYLGRDYVVMASVGHVRDLPSRAPKGTKQEVPGVDLEHDFQPTYEILPDKQKTVGQLKKAAKGAADVWFATDLDREGEAIAWHLAQALGVAPTDAKRVVFNAITKREIEQAFAKPNPIDENKVNAQQARRILDRIVGYQVSPLLWKKVAGGLSAGRVQSVAVRLVVEREREIQGFVPDEEWKIIGAFAKDVEHGTKLKEAWLHWLDEHPRVDDAGKVSLRTNKEKLAWLNEHGCLQAELVEIGGKKFEAAIRVDKIIGPLSDLSSDAAWAERLERAAATFAQPQAYDLSPQIADVARQCGLRDVEINVTEEPDGRGPARWRRTVQGSIDPAMTCRIKSIETRRTRSYPPPPFITSTLQQVASTRLFFPLQKTMRVAQQLYEGVDIHGKEGQTGLITYMRTDSTHLSGEALTMARDYIKHEWGQRYLPDEPKFYATKNQNAQEAHEAIRPTDVSITPKRVRNELTEDQYKLYKLIWERFLACQCTPAEWDATTIHIQVDAASTPLFRTSGRTLVFDGFYKALGVPNGGDDAIFPSLNQNQIVAPLQINPTQHFTNPPPRYTEASLQKKLEEEGIGRPSTYAAIISTIQDRKYVQQLNPRDRRLLATDLGKVVSDKLVESFPTLMDVAYTRQMEEELDKVESEHHDWVTMLHQFYGPFRQNLDKAHEVMVHAKAEMQPAPFKCEKCGAPTVYRFGKNGRFLSCGRYPDCDYAAPIDREGQPMKAEMSDIACPECGGGMTRRVGRFGPFLGCENYPKCKGIVRLDPKKGTVVPPKVPPLQIDVPCPKCGAPLNMRRSKRGPWLSCSKFPKCRGRLGWTTLEEAQQAELEKALTRHETANPVPQIRTSEGRAVDDAYIPQIIGGEESQIDSDAA